MFGRILMKIPIQLSFTFQPERDESGAAIALFTASRHYPMTVDHQTTLQGIVFQLDVALEELETLKAGLIFIYDMSGSKYSNFDYELSKKILTLLKVIGFYIETLYTSLWVSACWRNALAHHHRHQCE